jgi:hypothetical protein
MPCGREGYARTPRACALKGSAGAYWRPAQAGAVYRDNAGFRTKRQSSLDGIRFTRCSL